MNTMTEGGTTTDGRTATVGSPLTGSNDPGKVSLRQVRRGRAVRRIGLLLLIAFLVLGALGFFGLRMGNKLASANGYQLQVSYPQTGRPGIGAPLQIQVQKQDGFDGPITVTMSNDYLDILHVNGVDPEPSQVTSTDKEVIWQFNNPPGNTLTVSLDAEFEPDEHPGSHDATVSVLDNGKPQAQVQFTTWEAP